MMQRTVQVSAEDASSAIHQVLAHVCTSAQIDEVSESEYEPGIWFVTYHH